MIDHIRIHRLLMRLALVAGNTFAWIAIFEYFAFAGPTLAQAFGRTALLYALVQVLMCLIIPRAAHALRHGAKAVMIWGVLWCAAAFVFLGAVFSGLFGGVYTLAIVVFALLMGLYRALYWIPYEVERDHARERSHSHLDQEILLALIPALVGLLLGEHIVQESWIFFAAGALMIISIVPLVSMPEQYERFPWTYRETFGELFSRRHRHMAKRAIIDGFQGAALLLVWPLAVFLITGWSYVSFGAIFSLSLLIVMLVRGTMGDWMRRVQLRESTSVRAAVVMSAWIGRLAAGNPISVILVDVYAHGGRPHVIGIDHWNADQSADRGMYVDEYTALRELGMGLGRLIACFLAAALVLFVSIPGAVVITFFIAALAAGASILFANGPPSIL